MPKLNMVIEHNLSRGEALNRIKSLLQDLKREHSDKISNLKEEWNGFSGKFSFKAKGFSVSGTITVKISQVELVANLPFAAMFFKGKIEEIIRERATELLA